MQLTLNTKSIEDYRRFLAIKKLPAYSFCGHQATFPDEYATLVDGVMVAHEQHRDAALHGQLFDYQRDISALAIKKRKFAVFADCGLGKTLILLEFARHANEDYNGRRGVLIVSPNMVVDQTLREAAAWYPDMAITRLHASTLQAWLTNGSGIAIVNYDALHDDLDAGNLGALILDESSMLKSMYGAWGQSCLQLGRGLKWKLCLTGTPAPNDRIEYANHAVFLDHFPTVNSFLARFFVNRGQTDNRWELKPHALEPFYRALSHWSIFLTNPATYGWKDNCGTLPPIHVSIEHVEMTPEQSALVRKVTGNLVATSAGGITSRSTMGQIAKGFYKGELVPTNKYEHIRKLSEQWPNESGIVWCHYNDEQDAVASLFPDAANIDGSTKHETRLTLIDDFKSGRRRMLVSKPRILGFGLNLQIATRQVFSCLQDSYEEYYQAIKRSNRIGSDKPLYVHIPVTEIERPMIETVLRKCRMVEQDTQEQERIFKKYGVIAL